MDSDTHIVQCVKLTAQKHYYTVFRCMHGTLFNTADLLMIKVGMELVLKENVHREKLCAL